MSNQNLIKLTGNKSYLNGLFDRIILCFFTNSASIQKVNSQNI
jgi:hypothetical protein